MGFWDFNFLSRARAKSKSESHKVLKSQESRNVHRVKSCELIGCNMPHKAVRVCVRTRPSHQFAQDNILIDEEHATIVVNSSDPTPADTMLNNKESSFKFQFDHIFHNSSQQTVYDLYARDTVQGVVDGTNGAIMSYGQTGSGKTFTMLGDIDNYEHRGVAPRSLSHIFQEVNSRVEIDFKVSCTYLELYNEQFFDLLQDLANPDVAGDYSIAEEKNGRGVFVRGLTEVGVETENEALNLLFTGQLSRTTAMHKLNKKSNRSHSIFTVYLQQRQASGVSERIRHSKLHLVDLAGSERLKKTMNSDFSSSDVTIRKESMSINQSLSYLEQCVVALARRGGSGYVPYRQSRLTNILKDCLGTNCNTLMLACMWGERNHLEETISTLRLASRMKQVRNQTSSVETVDTSTLVKNQAKLIKALKQELLMHDALVERTGMSYEPYTPEQQASVAQMVNRYVEAPEMDQEEELNISSYRQMLEVCRAFKKLVLGARDETRVAREEAMVYGTSREGLGVTGPLGADGRPATGFMGEADGLGALGTTLQDYDPNSTALVGERSGEGGFALGKASQNSRPPGGAVEGVGRTGFGPTGGLDTNKHGMGSLPSSPAARTGGPGEPEPLSPGAASMGSVGFGTSGGGELSSGGPQFESFIRSPEGSEFYSAYLRSKQAARASKIRAAEAARGVNAAKDQIDMLTKRVAERKEKRIASLGRTGLTHQDMEDIVDSEELNAMRDLREAKRTYKNGYEQLLKIKSVLNSDNAAAAESKIHLLEMYGSSRQTSAPPEERLDDQEAFDRLEEQRVLQNDPESMAYFYAQKTRNATKTQNTTQIKRLQKNKRFG
jgi:kinesin family protein 6/9